MFPGMEPSACTGGPTSGEGSGRMANGLNGNETALIGAIRGRRAQLPQRMMMTGLVALALSQLVGWTFPIAWFIGYALCQGVEVFAFGPVLRRETETLSRWRAVLGCGSFLLSAVVFGSLTVPLWLFAGAFGGVVAILLISATIMSLVVASGRSRLALGLTVGPHFAYLASTPFFMEMLGSTTHLTSVVTLACLIFCAYTLSLWRTMDNTRAAERGARDESERKRLEAEAANTSQTAFVAAISHELRTPISAMLAGAAELARGAQDAQARNQAVLISDAGRMMKSLLDDILDHAKLQAGRMSVEASAFDVRSLTAQVVRFWTTEARKKGLRLRVEGASTLPDWVEGDPTRLRQILNNLISNAVKFTSEGSVTLRLSAWASEENNAALRFQVVDTGQGMAPDQVARLFTPFEQGDASVAGAHGGSGLGLSISRNLARLMGGHLTAFSVAGSGSVFTLALTFPRAEAQAGAPPAEAPEPYVARAAAPVPAPAPALVVEPEPVIAEVAVFDPEPSEPLPVEAEAVEAVEEEERPVRILVADDHEINRRAVQLVLAPTGALMTAVVNGAEAVEAARVEAFDVIIMDVRMPEMDGREATRRIRAMAGPNQNVPIIAVTADTEDTDKAACRDAGMNAFVGKPIDPTRLLNTVIEAVNGGYIDDVQEGGRAASA